MAVTIHCFAAGRRNKTAQKWVVNEPKTEAGKRVIPMVDTVYTALMEKGKAG